MKSALVLLAAVLLAASSAGAADDGLDGIEHGYADNGGVKIHYVALGEGPLLAMLHGFPDFWYTWRHQMPALAETHRVVAIDLRGYNLSGQPEGQENYDMALLVEDVAAVIRAEGRESAIVAGHDWGGAIAWQFAMTRPEMTEKLIIVNLPHPRGLMRELANNAEQRANSQYARNFQQEGAHVALSPEMLADYPAKTDEERRRYIEAFQRSSIEAMLHYYKQNYPREPYQPMEGEPVKAKAPVLMIHGLDDTALLPGALNDNWLWVDNVMTLVTVPGAGHWVHHDKPELTTRAMRKWLDDD